MRDETYDYGLAPGERFEPDDQEEIFDLSRPHVMTVLGPVEPDDLGFTLHHEHIIRKPRDVGTAEPDLILDDPARSLTELEDAFNVGLRAIVDMTPFDRRPDLNDILWVAQRSPVHIILPTGSDLSLYQELNLDDDEQADTAASYVAELTRGMGSSPVKAGLIRVGTSLNRITESETMLLRSAAWAHAATGAPISAVTSQGTMALELIEVLQSEGVDPHRVIVGHLDEALDEDYLRRVLETGAFVSFDQIGKKTSTSNEARAAMVKRLANGGYVDQLLLSGGMTRRSFATSDRDAFGWSYLVESFPLALMDAGVDAPTVRRLFVDNPARALTILR